MTTKVKLKRLCYWITVPVGKAPVIYTSYTSSVYASIVIYYINRLNDNESVK